MKRKKLPKRLRKKLRLNEPIEPEDNGWKEGYIDLTIELQNHGRRETRIQGAVQGTLVLHLGVCTYADLWCITHKPSGFRFAYCYNRDDARRIGERLNRDCPRALAEKTKEGILSLMPLSVYQWLATCVKEKRYVDSN